MQIESSISNNGKLVLYSSGEIKSFDFELIRNKLNDLINIEPKINNELIEVDKIIDKIETYLPNKIKSSEITLFLSETIAYMSTTHPDYGLLAGRVLVRDLHEKTPNLFSHMVYKCNTENYVVVNATEILHSLFPQPIYNFIQKHKKQLDAAILHDNDYAYDYFAIKTLMKSYLLKIGLSANNSTSFDRQKTHTIIERPQYLLMRVAIQMYYDLENDDLSELLNVYKLMSLKYFTQATPTLFNSCMLYPQLSSCFLLTTKEDSIDGIYDTLKDCALISKGAGGIGISIHNIRSKGSYILSTDGYANGIAPVCKLLNTLARHVDQGGGKRKGSLCAYIEPWHGEIERFLSLKRKDGPEDSYCPDLNFALWIPNLFWKRVLFDEDWTLFCPNEAPKLSLVYGKEFEELYEKYEKQTSPLLAKKKMKARELLKQIILTILETGGPFILNKDECNAKSNHKHLGTIQSSNLCTEIVEYTAPDEVAVCNLASIALPKCLVTNRFGGYQFDHSILYNITQVCVKNLNNIIDKEYYVIPETQKSNFDHRPMAIGCQGLADVFIKLRLPYQSEEACQLQTEIYETMYYAAISASCDLAKKLKKTYKSYPGSPMSQGIFQFDMWGVTPSLTRWNWTKLKKRVKQYGVYNSLFIAQMPTATTSQILGNNESFEPLTSNMYTRRTLAGDFLVINSYLISDLLKLNLWNKDMKDQIILNNGSIQSITVIPQEIRNLYKTAWEIPPSCTAEFAAKRSPYIDQSQSLNLFLSNPDIQTLVSYFIMAYELKLKTVSYYIRQKPAIDPIKFSIDPEKILSHSSSSSLKNTKENIKSNEGPICKMEQNCEVCT